MFSTQSKADTKLSCSVSHEDSPEDWTIAVIAFKSCWQTSTGIEELKKQPEGDVTITIPSVPINQNDCKLKGISPKEQFAFLRLPQGRSPFSVLNTNILNCLRPVQCTQIDNLKMALPTKFFFLQNWSLNTMTYPYTNAQIRSILNGLGYRNRRLKPWVISAVTMALSQIVTPIMIALLIYPCVVSLTS